MSSKAIENVVRHFFEDYRAAFDAVDGARIAALYHAPTITMRADGSIHCLESSDALAEFFQRVAERYVAEGYRASRFRIVDLTPIGTASALATLDWELLREDGSLIRSWRQSYNIVRVDDAWRIILSTFHVP